MVQHPTREPNFPALRLHLSRLRANRGWSYDLLAEKTGVTRRTLISIETGATRGALDSWFRIAEAFDLPLGELLAPLSLED
ncbi:helix-turn-helix transcriptional regulator [Curtobacterium sp. NPDC089991]|uniref:helix-turn-helix transcriptional regulator n=1 Tax=Curtobacterium sp. NPDC089991 TaxID=3363969 RepID=UPI0038012498